MNLPNLKEARKRTNNKVLTKRFIFDNKYNNVANGKKYYLKTYGCQMNEHDSENIASLLEKMGFGKVETMEEANLVILNTCSIRENAHNKVFGLLGRAKHIKETKKDLIVGITGCMAQEEVVTNTILEKYKWIDFVIGTHKLEQINEIVYKSLIKASKQLTIEAPSYEGDIIEDLPCKRINKYKAFVNIMLGCDKFCTYCIVPYTRGKQRSRMPENIINEVKELASEGYQEVTLLGQNVNAYGKDLDINYTMTNLLEDVAKTGINRIRFVTSHPWDFTDDMIDTIAKYDNIMPSIHLPVQSGDDDILKLMGRRYTKDDYLTLFNKIKEKIPNVAISTDIIVGFPNESNEQFENTLDLVDKCKFDLAYTFIYSKRVGTPAETMFDPISQIEKEKRLAKLNEKINYYALENNKKLLNKIVPVLVEGVSEKDESMLMGYTDTNKLVNFTGPKDTIGKIVNVKITDVKTWSLDGEYIN